MKTFVVPRECKSLFHDHKQTSVSALCLISSSVNTAALIDLSLSLLASFCNLWEKNFTFQLCNQLRVRVKPERSRGGDHSRR